MSETQVAQEPDTKGAVNRSWVITLFGTAVGAGILFLPISAGSFGFWPLLIATVLIGPMTYLAHLAFSWMMSSSRLQGEDVLVILTDYFGKNAGIVIAIKIGRASCRERVWVSAANA